MNVYIKNADTVAHTYQGHILAAGEYHLVNSDEEIRWAHDELLLVDIANQIAIVSKVDNSTGDIIDISNAIDFLKNNLPSEVLTIPKEITSFIHDASTNIVNIPAGTTVDLDYKLIPISSENYQHLFGGTLITQNHNFGDYVVFQVVDKDNILGYGAGIVIKEYVRRAYILNDGQYSSVDSIGGELPMGLYLRCKYTSTGVDDVNAVINYDLRLKL